MVGFGVKIEVNPALKRVKYYSLWNHLLKVKMA